MNAKSISGCERRFREGRWDQQLVDDVWELATFSSDAKSVNLVYDIQHCLSGLNSEHLKWFDTWQNNQTSTCWPLFWRLLSAEIHMGLTLEARSRLAQLDRQKWSLWRMLALYRFPLPLNFMNRQKISKSDLVTLWLKTLADSLMKRTISFPQWCAESLGKQKVNCCATRIAVVGNGPSMTGSAAGERIDSADLVIRFNRIHTSESIRHDTGQHTGLWVISPGFSFTGSKNKMPCRALCISGPAPFMRASRYWSRLARLPFSSMALTPLDSWYSLVRLLEAPPSAGILVLHALMSHFPNLQIELHGFTTDTSEAEDKNNAGSHYGDRHTASTRHNWQRETMLIQQWISSNKLR